ncbi:allene oxide synthase-lipoxygenase protein-like [Tachypleus tridentatus]
MRMLSTKATKSLGDFEVRYLFDPSDVEAHREFVEELKNISEKIKKRNETRKCAYTWLDPEIIPNSVAI